MGVSQPSKWAAGLIAAAVMGLMLGGSLPGLLWFAPKASWAQDDPSPRNLWEAARAGDRDRVEALLKEGVDVNARTEYGATALFYACDRGHLEVVRLLLENGADAGLKDRFYQASPLTWARQKGHNEIVALLLRSGVPGAEGLLLSAVRAGNREEVAALIESGAVRPLILKHARALAESGENARILELFRGVEAGAPPDYQPPPEAIARFAGRYRSPRMNIEIQQADGELKLESTGMGSASLQPIAPNEFLVGASPVRFHVAEDGSVSGLTFSMAGNELEFTRAAADSEPPAEGDATVETGEAFPPSRPESLAADREISSANWPSFRGLGARGIAEGQDPPASWDVPEGTGVAWKTPIPGLGLSCPTLWGDRIYLTSAVSEEGDRAVRIGLYGDVDSVEEDAVYDFRVYCFNKQNGELLWEQTARSAKPAVKRHAKSSHANPTIATDGEHVVAFFGSEGLYCYSNSGELLWQVDLGVLDSGWFYDAGYQWGFGSSPILFDGRVIVQCDIQQGSFVAAFDLATGEEVWRTSRDEIPSWSTPTVHRFGDLPMLITHGTRAARGYDARTGELLWSLPRHSEIVVPTPFVAHGLIYLASGYSPIQPIYAVRPDARGEIEVGDVPGEHPGIAWGKLRGGPYMPSPLVYGDYLYCCGNSGILSCYQAETGAEVYRERLRAEGPGRLSFTASPVAADGKLYLASEDGRVLVVRAGPQFELLHTNPTGENILATPAISDGRIYLRTVDSLIAVGDE